MAKTWDNETWVIEEGDRIIQKKAELGSEFLTTWERLVYSLWIADYGMRNGGSLETGMPLYPDFQSVALHAAVALSLPVTRTAFAMEPEALEERYFDLFDAICKEIRNAERGGTR